MRRLGRLEWVNLALGAVLLVTLLAALFPSRPPRRPEEPAFSTPVVVQPSPGRLSRRAAARAALEEARRRPPVEATGPAVLTDVGGQPFED